MRAAPRGSYKHFGARFAATAGDSHVRGGLQASSEQLKRNHAELSLASSAPRPSDAPSCDAEAGPSSSAAAAQQRWQLASLALGSPEALTGSRSLALLTLAGGLMGSGFDIQGPLSQAQALAVLAAIVTVHECGHFLAARLQVRQPFVLFFSIQLFLIRLESHCLRLLLHAPYQRHVAVASSHAVPACLTAFFPAFSRKRHSHFFRRFDSV